MGASQLARTICSEAGFEGYLYTIGAAEGMETEAFAQARLILIWGSNTLTSNLHLWPFVQEARKAGRTCHRHRPGTHAHGPGRRRVDRHSTRHRRRAGPGHDARDHRRGAARCRLCRTATRSALTNWRERVAEWTPATSRRDHRHSGRTHRRRWPATTPPRGRRPSASTTACSVTGAAAWPCAPSPACLRWSAPGATMAAASN